MQQKLEKCKEKVGIFSWSDLSVLLLYVVFYKVHPVRTPIIYPGLSDLQHTVDNQINNYVRIKYRDSFLWVINPLTLFSVLNLSLESDHKSLHF